MNLPTLVVPIRVVNPAWKQGDDMANYYITQDAEVQVMTVNFNAGTMRVRPPRIPGGRFNFPIDMSADAFFQKYNIKEL